LRPRAVIFDFNGTISDDEPLLDRLFREVLAAEGVDLTSDIYFAELSGLSDPEIVVRALEIGGVEPTLERRERVLHAKIDRYKDEVRRELTVDDGAAGFVRGVAARVPIGIASGAAREEVELVLELAGIGDLFEAIVCIDDVEQGKPDPSGYLLAMAQLNEERSLHESIVAGDVLAIEDSLVGVQAAHAAGLRCAVVGEDDRAQGVADLVLEELSPATAASLFR